MSEKRVQIRTLQELLELPDGARVVPYGYQDTAVTVKGGDAFRSKLGVCPAEFMGLPATLIEVSS